MLITPSLGVPNWSVIYINTAPSTSFLAPLLGRKKTSARGVSHAQSFTLFLVLLYFLFACIVLSKIQKIASFIVVTLLLLVHMLFCKYVLEDLSVGSGSIIGKGNIEEFFNHISMHKDVEDRSLPVG